MKRMIIAIILLIFVFSACFAENMVINSHFKKIIQKTNNAIKYAEQDDYEKVKELSTQISDGWAGAENMLSSFIPRSELDEVTMSAAKLVPLCGEKTKEHFISECELIKATLDHIIEKENLDFNEVF